MVIFRKGSRQRNTLNGRPMSNKSLRGLVAAWLCMDAGFFIAAYVNDVMQYPNQLPVYIGFALCFAAPHIDKRISEEENTQSVSTPETDEQI